MDVDFVDDKMAISKVVHVIRKQDVSFVVALVNEDMLVH